MSSVPRLASYDDLWSLPEHVIGQIIDGQLQVQPRPSVAHARSQGRLFKRIDSGFDDDDGGSAGWWILQEPELHLGPHVLVPDIAGWRRQRLPQLPMDPFLSVAPDWVCEVLSPGSTRIDRGPKMRLYAEWLVAHLWLVDPLARTLETYALDPTTRRWTVLETRSGDDRIRLPPFDEVEIPLARLWVD